MLDILLKYILWCEFLNDLDAQRDYRKIVIKTGHKEPFLFQGVAFDVFGKATFGIKKDQRSLCKSCNLQYHIDLSEYWLLEKNIHVGLFNSICMKVINEVTGVTFLRNWHFETLGA